MKTFLKRLSGILVVLVGLHLIVIGIENWRGARAFERWRAATIAAGEPQSLEQMAPPKVPDAENFAAHPAIAARISGKPQPEGPVLPAALSDGELFRAWEGGRPVDLAALQAQLKVTDLGPLLDPFAAQLRGVEEASLRPHSRLLGSYEGDDIPSLLGMRQLARVLSLRALLALRAGHSKAALADVLTILRVAKHLGPEPQLISQLLSLATLRISFQPIWEGLRDHRWNDAQLAQLQGALGDLDLLSGWRRCWTAEGLQFRTQLEKLARTPLGSRPPIFGDATGKNGKVANFLGQLILPNGWIYQNQIRMEQHWRRQYIEVLDPAWKVEGVIATEFEEPLAIHGKDRAGRGGEVGGGHARFKAWNPTEALNETESHPDASAHPFVGLAVKGPALRSAEESVGVDFKRLQERANRVWIELDVIIEQQYGRLCEPGQYGIE